MTTPRFLAGEHTETEILASAPSVVSDWLYGDALASWSDVFPSRIVTPEAIEEEALNGSLLSIGGLNFTWTFPILNEAMYHYLKDSIFAGERRIKATVYMRNRDFSPVISAQWVAIVAWAERPRFTIEDMNPRDDKWYAPVTIKFFDGYYADEG